MLVSIDRGGLDARVSRGGIINVERLLFGGKVDSAEEAISPPLRHPLVCLCTGPSILSAFV